MLMKRPMKNAISIYGKFQSKQDASRALRALSQCGVTPDHIGVMLPDYEVSSDFGTSRARRVRAAAAVGAIIALVPGVIFGILLFGIPGVLTGMSFPATIISVGASFFAFFSAVAGALVGLRFSKRMTRKKNHRDKGVLVTVSANGTDLENAQSVLLVNGAHSVHVMVRAKRWRMLFANWEEVDKSFLGPIRA